MCRLTWTEPIVALLLALSFQVYSRAEEIYVSPDGAEPIQQAIDRAHEGDVVILRPGIYTDWINFNGKAVTVRSMDPEDPAVVAATVIDANGTTKAVAFLAGEGPDSVLSGLTIRGVATSNTYYDAAVLCYKYSSPTIINNVIEDCRGLDGSALMCEGFSSPLIANNVFRNNKNIYEDRPGLSGVHAAVHCYYGCNPVIINNEIINNDGPGIWALSASPTITNNRIIGNKGAGILGGGTSFVATDNEISLNVGFEGGGLGWANFSPVVTNNLIVGNRSEISPLYGGGFGGGLYVRPIDYTLAISAISHNTIVGNYAEVQGGGGSFWESSAVISDNLIVGNATDGTGGGIHTERGPTKLYDNIMAGNSAAFAGGGIHWGTHDNSICIKNTIVLNRSETGGGGRAFYAESRPALTNCVVWGNEAAVGAQLDISGIANVTVSHSLVSVGREDVFVGDDASLAWGLGNADGDPLLVDPGHWDDNGTPDDPSDDTFVPGDYSLLPGSPCIDAGTNDLPVLYIKTMPDRIDGDLDGDRVFDIGKAEYLPGDVNYDGKVNVLDLILVRNSLGRDPASSIEARKADANADGAVNVEDLIFVRGQLGK